MKHLSSMFDHAVATAPDKVALRHLNVALTYREVGRAVTALAQRLARIVAPGEVVALVLPNSIEPKSGSWVIATMGGIGAFDGHEHNSFDAFASPGR